MGRPLQLQGKRFGRLVAISKSRSSDKGVYWLCKCDCGNVVEVNGSSLNMGHTRSCGCLIKDVLTERNKKNAKHGMGRSRLYGIYYSMKHRCYNKSTNGYERYGGRGIKVCDEWNKSFDAFKEWAFGNGYKDSLTLDRIDNDGDYEPGNCRWTTHKEQSINRRDVKLYSHNGEKLCLKDWARKTGISYSALHQRVNRGMPFEQAICMPYKKRRSRRIK